MQVRLPITLAGSILIAMAFSVNAQTPSSESVSNISLEEIVVTARRKSESIADVPQVVDAVTAEALAKYNVQQLQDVQSLVPGLTLSADGTGYQSKAALRGVNFEVTTSTSPTVAFYLNDAVTDANFIMQSLFDVGQIEVLRGPQGTLRGRSAPSGAITVTTRKPDLTEFGGFIAAMGTNRDHLKGDAAINLPIIHDMLAVRFAGLTDSNEFDHVKSVSNPRDPSQRTKAGRASVAFQPTDALNFSLMYQYLNKVQHSYIQVAGAGAPGNLARLPDGSFNACVLQTGATSFSSIPCPAAGYNGPALTPEDRLAVSNHTADSDVTHEVITAAADYRFSGQRLSYVGGYTRMDVPATAITDTGNMLPGGNSPNQPTRVQQHESSHEIRLTSEERIASLFDYTVGLFYSLDKPHYDLNFPGVFLSGAFGTPFGLPNPYAVDSRYLVHVPVLTTDSQHEERSVFASFTWHINEQTEFTAGARHLSMTSRDVTNGDLVSDGIIAIPAFLPPPAGLGLPAGTPCAFVPGSTGSTYANTCDMPSSIAVPSVKGVILSNANQKWTPTVWNASLSHHFNEGFLAYLNYGTAWRRGVKLVGIQNADPAFDPFVSVQPENSKSWEVGFKSMLFDKRAQINLALYRQKYDGFIHLTPYVTYLANLSGSVVPQTFQFTTNVPAIVEGLDFDGSFQITKQWSAGVAASYSDGHMQNGVEPCNAPIAPGKFLALCTSNGSISSAPKWNANLRTEYFLPIGSILEGYVRGLFTYYPKNDRASGEGAGFTADAYGLLNLYTGIRSANGSWDIQLFAKNLTNTNKALSYDQTSEKNPIAGVNLNFGQSGYYRTSATLLREFGITARYSFGSR